MDLELLDRRLGELGEPAYRAGQIWRWTAQGAAGFDEMTDVPARLRATLAESIPLSTLVLDREAHARDGTVKALFRRTTAGRSRRC